MLLRDALRSARRWQTYGIRSGFTALLVAGVLLALHAAVGATRSGMWDVADLGWLGRGLFVAFTVSQLLLATLLAPMMTASAVIDETDERTLELLVLTRLTPRRVLVGLVSARLLVLLTIVAGALPVLTLVVTLGGVSTVEVVAVTIHTLTTIVVMGLLGAVFAMFTRSPMLAAMGSAMYVIPAFWLLPLAYTIATGHPPSASRFSTFSGPFAEDWSALVAPLSFAPATLLILQLGTRLFELRVSGAHIRHAFSAETWRTRRWLMEVGALMLLGAFTAPILVPLSWVAHQGNGLPGAVTIVVDVALWALFAFVAYVGTWAWLRVGVDVVDATDRLVGRRRKTEHVGAPRVWRNPVAWREARPRAWGATAMPILTTWGILLLTIAQSFWWVIPGGILLLGVLDGYAAIALGVWVATHSIAAERSSGTLPILLTTRLSTPRIVLGKLVGVTLASSPMLLLALPMLVFGVPHAWIWVASTEGFPILWIAFLGVASWIWLCAVWLAAVSSGMWVAMRVGKPQSAFGITLAAVSLLMLVPFLAGRLAPDAWLIAHPARLLAPPLAGDAGVVHFAFGISLAVSVGIGVLALLSHRLRLWGGAVLALLALAPPAEAADVVQDQGLALRVEAVGDPWIRGGRWTALQVTVANAGPGTTGVLSLTERDASEQVVEWTRPVDLPDGARKDVALRFRPGAHGRERQLRLTTQDGRELVAPVQLTPIAEPGVAIAVLGDDHLGLTGLDAAWTGPVPGRVPRADAADPRPVRTGLVPLDTAPDHAADWATFDWIVWPQADPSRLAEDQLAALLHAVADGAHLLVTTTDTARIVRESPLGDALPVALGGVVATELDVPGLLGLPAAGPRPTTIAAAEPVRVPGRTAWVLARDADGRPLRAAGTYGLGTVHVLLANPSAPELRATGPALWRRLLALPAPEESGHEPRADALPAELASALRAHRADAHPDCVVGAASGPWIAAPEDDWGARVRDRLRDIPGVAPIPLGWLVVFSGLYLLVIGPIDYLVLRRLRREVLTWVTFPVAIAIFSAVALIGTTMTKGNVAVLTRVELVDHLPGTELWRGGSRLGVFSTRKTSLAVENGFADAVVGPQASEAGFMNTPAVASSEGPTRLAYHAETWTLAYSETGWVEALGEGPRLRPRGDGWELTASLPVDLAEAWLVHAQGGAVTSWYPLGAVEAGETRVIGGDWATDPDLSDDMRWVRDTALEAAEGGRGHLHTAAYDRVLIGIAARPVEPIALSGLAPEERAITIVRAPLTPPTPLELP